jgi:glutathione S-transferase
MALIHLDVSFQFEQADPHSSLAYKHNPFGRIPSFLHKDKMIFETLAIREYIDAVISDKLTPKDLDTRIKMTQMISILNDYVFHHVLFGVAKRREMFELQGKKEEEIKQLLEGPLKKAVTIIQGVDKLVPYNGQKFLCGEQLTWADFLLFPVMADMYAIREGSDFIACSPNLRQWFLTFQARKEAKETFPGTTADTLSKKKSNI